MKNLTSSIQYIFKNLGLVVLFTLIPSLFLGSFYQMHGVTYFVANYYNAKITNIGSVFVLLFNTSFSTILFFVLTSIMLVVFLSAYTGCIENHFRMGKPNIKNASYYINSNTLAVLSYYLIFVMIMIIYKLLLTVILFTSHIIFSGVNVEPNMFTQIMALSLIGMTYIPVAFMFNYLILGFPITLYNGYSIRTSLSEASELLQGKHMVTVLGLIIPILLFFIILSMGKSYMFPWFANVLTVWGNVMYIPVYAYVCYFAYSNYERLDLKKRIIKR